MPTPARLAGVGAFVMAGLLLFAVGLFMIGDRQMAFARKFTVYTEFKKITGLAPGAIVRVAGAKAGSVKEIVPPNKPSEKFRVKLEIAENLHALVRTDSVASIETEGLVGGTFLGVGTGSDQAPKAPENSTIPGKEPFEISDLLQRMGETIEKVNTTIGDLSDDVQSAVMSIADTVENADNLINDVSDDVKTMASAGARITGGAAEITDNLRNGKGTIGKFLNDDEFYNRATVIAKNAEQIASDARQVVEQARQTLESFRAKDGPVQSFALNLKQTVDDARIAMSGFAENMEALKHNFFFRGFFNKRGYFDITSIAPAEYRGGMLIKDKSRRVVRVWLSSAVLFANGPGADGPLEQLTNNGKARLDSAIAPYLVHLPSAVLMIEGYAQQGSEDERFLKSRARATSTREYLIGKFHLDPQATGFMPLGAESLGSPDDRAWDGVALAVFVEKDSFTANRQGP